MKPQVVLFALLRAQAALSRSDEGSNAALPDCASLCKTNLRLRPGASALSECVRRRCGSRFQILKEEGENAAQSRDACVERCLILWYSSTKIDQCIEDNCDKDEDDRTPVIEIEGSEPDAEATEHDAEGGGGVGENAAQSHDACVERCLILWYSSTKIDQCIEDNCDKDEDDRTPVIEGSEPDAETAEHDVEEGGGGVGENAAQSHDACVERCLILWYSSTKIDQCIDGCPSSQLARTSTFM